MSGVARYQPPGHMVRAASLELHHVLSTQAVMQQVLKVHDVERFMPKCGVGGGPLIVQQEHAAVASQYQNRMCIHQCLAPDVACCLIVVTASCM